MQHDPKRKNRRFRTIRHIIVDSEIAQSVNTFPELNILGSYEKLSLTSEHGVQGCRWSHMPWLKKEDGSGDPSIQVSILKKRVLDLVYKPGGDTIHPGDTFIVDMDLSHENLPIGAILQSGSVQLRVGGHWNNACVKWKVRYGVDALNWVREDENIKYRLRGVLCEIIKDGIITNGELLTKL